MSISKHVQDYYNQSPEELDKWFEETEADCCKPNAYDVDPRPLIEKMLIESPLPTKEEVLAEHKRMFEKMVRDSGLTREEFLKRICEE